MISKAIILAAGEAKRLKPYTDTTPKCLLDISGMCSLGRQLYALKENNILNVVIVTGFREDKIIEYVKSNKDFNNLTINFISNKEWQTTNNGYSLFLALDQTKEEPFILLNADTVFHADIIKELKESQYDLVLACQKKRIYDEEEMQVKIFENSIVDIGKAINSTIEFTGIAKFSGELLHEVLGTFKFHLIGSPNSWFEGAIKKLLPYYKFHYLNVSHLPSKEIDTLEDLEEARDRYPFKQPDWEQGLRHKSLEEGKRNLEDAFFLYSTLVKLLEENNIKCWANWGTLLGIIRDGNFIPWDTDMDLTIHTEDQEKLIKIIIPKMRSMGFFVVDIKKCYEGDFWFIDWQTGEKIELNTVHLIGNKYVYGPGRCNLAIPKEWIENLQYINFKGLKLGIPDHVEEYLAKSYGENWKTPLKNIKPKTL